MNITQEILLWLQKNKALKNLNLRKLLLTRSFAAVELTNGSVGTALNYDNNLPKKTNKRKMRDYEKFFLQKSRNDPLLYKTILKKTKNLSLTELALKVATLSALSRPFLNKRFFEKMGLYLEKISYNNHRYKIKKESPAKIRLEGLIKEGDIATVVGFGGYMKYFSRHPKIKKVYVTDMNCQYRMKSIQKTIKMLRKKKEEVFFKAAKFNRTLIKKSDIVSITASAMCNDTMKKLLQYSKNCRVVIIQGISGGVVPFPFFKHGVSLLVGETKNQEFIRAYEHNGREYYWLTEYDNRIFMMPEDK